MKTVGLLFVAVLAPTALAYGVVGARWLHARYQASRPALSGFQPIEAMGADLRRLHDLLEQVETATGAPGKYLRCQATRAAYLDALTVACRQLEVPPPAGCPVPRTEIYRAEAGLRRAGLDVRALA